jgi:prepilin-type N-terminal cleavage/methylation domain-containing protein
MKKNIKSKREFSPSRDTRVVSGESAFTLIELLIVVLISAMLSAVVITYSGVGRDEVSLSVESAAVAQTVLHAKSLAVAAYSTAASHACAFGVAFNGAANTYSVVKYDLPAGSQNCPSVASLESSGIMGSALTQYTANEWDIPLTNGVSLSVSSDATNSLTFVLFYPPDPKTLISLSECSPGVDSCRYNFVNTPAVVDLKTVGGTTQAITVDTGGQVTF